MKHLIKGVLAATAMFASSAWADTVKLTLPDHSMSAYISELVSKSLEAHGHVASITLAPQMGTQRFDALVSKGAEPFVTFKARRRVVENAVVIETGLTDGLLGKRVFFIKEGSQDRYSALQSREDLASSGLVGGFGKNWYDVNVWTTNNLPVKEVDGDWRNLYAHVAAGNRKVDYFSRGIMEIAVEAKEHTDLGVESDLLVVYPGDFHLFMSPMLAEQAGIIEAALKDAAESGLRDELLRKHFAEIYDPAGLNMDGRRVIQLDSPAS